jgi:hypothetical protein
MLVSAAQSAYREPILDDSTFFVTPWRLLHDVHIYLGSVRDTDTHAHTHAHAHTQVQVLYCLKSLFQHSNDARESLLSAGAINKVCLI